MSGSISAHALFIFLGEMHYTSLQSMYPLSSLFLCGCFLEFDMQDTRLRIDCWRVAPYQWNLFFKLQRAHFLQVAGGRSWIIYIAKLKPPRGWIHLHNGLISSRATVLCHVQWPFWLQYMFIYHPECMCVVCFMNVTDEPAVYHAFKQCYCCLK